MTHVVSRGVVVLVCSSKIKQESSGTVNTDKMYSKVNFCDSELTSLVTWEWEVFQIVSPFKMTSLLLSRCPF